MAKRKSPGKRRSAKKDAPRPVGRRGDRNQSVDQQRDIDEQSRRGAEHEREHAEKGRVHAEGSRGQYERMRQAHERIRADAEEARQVAEEARRIAERARAEAQDTRRDLARLTRAFLEQDEIISEMRKGSGPLGRGTKRGKRS